MKSYQFFKMYKPFYKKREKAVIQQSMRKVGFFSFNRLFYEALEMAINHFFFSRSFCSQDTFLFFKLVNSAIFVF